MLRLQIHLAYCANRSRQAEDDRTRTKLLVLLCLELVHHHPARRRTPPSQSKSRVVAMPPSKYDKAKQEKNEAFKDLLKALEAQDGELTDHIERMEEKVLNLEARNQKDSQPVVSVFADLARQAAWST